MNDKRSDHPEDPGRRKASGRESESGRQTGIGHGGDPGRRVASGRPGDPGGHLADRIQALVDGSLDLDQAMEVRAHCEHCPDCGRVLAEAERVWTLLSRDPEPVLAGRVWPLVHERMHPARPLRSRLSWAATAGFAAVAGLLLGLYLGPHDSNGNGTWEQATWGEVGSLLADGSGLDGIYLDASVEETAEGAQP